MKASQYQIYFPCLDPYLTYNEKARVGAFFGHFETSRRSRWQLYREVTRLLPLVSLMGEDVASLQQDVAAVEARLQEIRCPRV